MKILNPSLIEKFETQLEKLPIFIPSLFKRKSNINYHYNVDACEFYQQILPLGYNKTKVWGFAGLCKDSKTNKIRYIKSSPGPTFEVERNTNTNIQWNNKILSQYMFKVDTNLFWANPNNINKFNNEGQEGQWPPTLVMHVHGMITSPLYDGNPRTWSTATGIKGPLYTTNYYKFNNEQPSCMLWYYDQSPGLCRISVYSGLCGMYLIKDEKTNLPKDDYYIPMIIQDKSFYENGDFYYNDEYDSKENCYWKSKFLGNTIVVNGKVWPTLKVKNQLYRFHIVNGSNYRHYKIALSDNSFMIQIGSDAGCISKPQKLNYFVLYPGERIEILIDFSKYKINEKVIMKNLFEQNECGDIMQFEIENIEHKIEYNIPNVLATLPKIETNSSKVSTFIIKNKKNNKICEFLFDKKNYLQPPTNITKVGSSFIWEFINLTKEDTCVHIHLVHFQIVERQKINEKLYEEKYNNELTNVDEIYEEIVLPPKYEDGFKDTVYCPSFFVTRIKVRYAPFHIMENVKVGENFYSFNPSEGPEYIINSQMLEQKDNCMVRPQIIISE